MLSDLVRRTIDCTIAIAFLARWSTSRASIAWRSSASLRSVMSIVTPLTRRALPPRRRARAPADLGVRAADAELGLIRLAALQKVVHADLKPLPVFREDEH